MLQSMGLQTVGHNLVTEQQQLIKNGKVKLNGHGFGWTVGVGDGWGGLACCGSWGRNPSGGPGCEQLHRGLCAVESAP